MKAVYAGSFSPPTLGHLDIISRAAELFDELIIAVLCNAQKYYVFTEQQRMDMLYTITAQIPNVRIVCDQGLLVDLVRREKADVIVRGIRSQADLPYELQLSDTNFRIGGVETIFLSSRPEYSTISSSIVRECASYGAPIDSMVHKEIVGLIYGAFGIQPMARKKG